MNTLIEQQEQSIKIDFIQTIKTSNKNSIEIPISYKSSSKNMIETPILSKKIQIRKLTSEGEEAGGGDEGGDGD